MIRETLVTPPTRTFLEAVPLFSCVTPAERELLSAICRVRVYEKGERVFAEGEEPLHLSFVIIGSIKIVKEAQGRDIIVGIFGPGETFGAVAVFERTPYPASAVALEPSTILEVPEREFFALLTKHPEIVRRLLEGLMVRQLELTRRIADMSGSVEYRAARLFSTLVERLGVPRGEGVFIPLSLSRQEIADLIGTTIETAIRLMSRWGKEDLVATKKDGFFVKRPAALKKLTETA